ncbi:type III pantothenate kinase [bacterium]|nr:type III pantothenate kinase [bacterium]
MSDNSQLLLAFDVGNTHIVMGIFRNGDLVVRRRMSTQSSRTSDEAGVLVKMLCQDGGIDPAQIDAVAIASVAPKTGMVIGEMAESFLGCKPLFVHGEIPGFANHYRNPRAVGADRVCDAVAGFAKYGGPLLILDFGTAITFDAIEHDGAYMGGVIMPGIETSAQMLKTTTALLPEARLTFPENAIGKTTDESIQIGLMTGAVFSIRGIIQRMRDELGDSDATVIATGGMAKIIVPHLPEVKSIEPNLVLEGIRIIHQWSKLW